MKVPYVLNHTLCCFLIKIYTIFIFSLQWWLVSIWQDVFLHEYNISDVG